MDYFLFDFSGVQFHYTMSHLFFGCRIFTDFGYRDAADASVICINLVDGDNSGGFVFA